MNRNRHRVVFNAARGQFMAVSETANSDGGASTTTSSPGRPARRNKLFLAVLLAFSGPLWAQIVADPSAPGNQRPTILQTANGVPLVNIQTPSAAGVSRNTYNRFDIDNRGAILNNSRTPVPTHLGGATPGNPWINTPARVILNEVNSSNPTYLQGPVEVAGQRAEVVVANPSGIRVNGGSFLNASGVTLTTGTPVMNSGNLESFRVTQGTVVVEGLGLDTRTADHTTILARAMEVNAGLWAKHLTVVTGANDVKALATGEAAQATSIAGTGPAPTFMLDVAAIGGMYAGHIYLVGTEAGLGVNNRGTLAAQEGEWVLRADGWLVNTGKVQAKGDLSIQTTGTISNTGAGAVISSQGNATLTAGARVSNTGLATIAATGALGVHAGGSLDNTDGDMLSAGTLGVTTTGPLSNVRGQLQAVGAATIDTRGAKLDNTAGRVSSQSTLALTTGELVNGALAAQAGLIGSDGNLTIQAGAVTNGAAGTTQSNIWSAQTASVTTTSFTNAGVLSGTHVTLGATTGVSNAAGASIEADGNLTITAPTATLSNAGQLIANQTLNVKAKDIHNTDRMEATDQTLEATNTFNNAAGASVTASNAIDIGATTFNNRGLVNANEATGAAPASQVHLHATTVNNTGTGAIFGDRIAIAATTLNNRPEAAGGTAPVIAAREQLDIGVLTLNNEDGALLYSGGSMAVGGGLDAALAATGQAQAVNNLSADIEAIDHLRIATQTLTNERRNVSVSQVQVVDETANLNMPGWWVNGKNEHGKPIEATSNYTTRLYYLLDPTSIVSETPLVTPDGNVIYRVEANLSATDSVYHAAGGAYAGQYGVRERVGVGAGTVVLYAMQRQTGVTNPDQVAGTPDVFTSDISEVIYWQRNSLSYSNA